MGGLKDLGAYRAAKESVVVQGYEKITEEPTVDPVPNAYTGVLPGQEGTTRPKTKKQNALLIPS